jgi:hypothetical protein
VPNVEPIRRTSQATRPTSTVPPRNTLERWEDPDFLADILEAGGFAKEQVRVCQREIFVDVGDFDCHIKLLWSFRGMPSIGWTTEDEEAWDTALEILGREMQNTEGFRMTDDGQATLRFVVNIAMATK